MPASTTRHRRLEQNRFDLEHFVASRTEAVNQALDAFLPRASTPPATIHRAMRYSLFAGGKRMRPALCLAAAAACGGAERDAMGATGFAMAQEQAQESQQAQAEEQQKEQPGKPTFEDEIQVTGSLIPRPTLEALSPVATMGIEEITYSGVTRIEDLMATLPQVFTAQNPTIANGASGTATIDLRQLGTFRTLVLIDGRRMAPGDPLDYSADVNFIPAPLLKRVDVLTGGASTTYGTDAVSGVVNFILDKEFEGVPPKRNSNQPVLGRITRSQWSVGGEDAP